MEKFEGLSSQDLSTSNCLWEWKISLHKIPWVFKFIFFFFELVLKTYGVQREQSSWHLIQIQGDTINKCNMMLAFVELLKALISP